MKRQVLVLLAAGLVACGGDSPTESPPDNSKPTVAIANPAAGEVDGAVVIEVTASENVGIARDRFRSNSRLLVEINRIAPYQ